jgi:hypothetical protein
LPYTENAPATAVDPGLTLTDAVSTSLVGATVAITDNYANGQDVLDFTDTPTITGSWDAATGTLTLTGTASLASYQAALRSISYANASDGPTTAPRTVTFTADDGSPTSNTGSGTRGIEITAVNDAPVNTVPGEQSVPANTALVFNAGNGNAISVAHPDSATDSVAVDLTVGHGTLTLGAVGGLTFEAGDGMADASMSFSGSLAAVNAALVGLSYSPALGYSGPDLVTLTSDDQGGTGIGGALSDTDTVSITVTLPTVLPDTTVTAGPTGWTRDSTPTFSFVADTAGATFECRVDDTDFAPCSSPHTTATLSDGPHTFTVRAVVAGFPDATPATRTLTVDLTAPYTGYVEVFLREGAQARLGPVLLTWQASDNLTAAAGLRHQIEVRRKVAGAWGSWHGRITVSGMESSWVLPLWHYYQYRVRTGDLAGNWSAWEESEPINIVRRQESWFTRTGGWAVVTTDGAMGHRVARSSTANATATSYFWGNGIALVMTTGAGMGTVEICLDPGTSSAQCRMVNLATFQPTGSRRLVAAFTELSRGYHRVSVRVVAGTIELDGALITR